LSGYRTTWDNECLEDPDPLHANIGAAASDILDIALKLKNLVDQALAEPGDMMAKLHHYSSLFDTYLKCMQQAERYLKLDKRVSDIKALLAEQSTE